MIILGIDPGTATTGFSIIEIGKKKHKLLDCGVVLTSKKLTSSTRLKDLFAALNKIIKKWQPDEMAVELLFFSRNVKTALAVGEAKGVVKLVGARSKLPVFEYNPMQVKLALTGYGHAEKEEVGRMVARTFKLKSVPKPDDAADAVAIGLCHIYKRKDTLEK